MRRLTARGYALWDVVAESERKGSLDADIKNATFADVQALVARHPSIRRICFSSGGTTAKLFRRTHKAWLASLTLAPAPAPTLTPSPNPNPQSQPQPPALSLTPALTLTRRGSPRPVPSSHVPTALRRVASSASGG